MTVILEGFTTRRDKYYMAESLRRMRRASNKATRALLSGKLEAYRKWFEAGTGVKHLMKVASIVHAIDRAIAPRGSKKIRLVNGSPREWQPGLGGFTHLEPTKLGNQGVGTLPNGQPTQGWDLAFSPGSDMRIFVFPGVHQNIPDLVETLYHELSHKIGGTWDSINEDVPGLCAQCAITDSVRAVNNAANYSFFLRDFL